eukprot:m.85196 g.85196  ORF g.85196 m.85196 type:complete len:598 (-) comp9623_c2_seq1:19-1812(-)
MPQKIESEIPAHSQVNSHSLTRLKFAISHGATSATAQQRDQRGSRDNMMQAHEAAGSAMHEVLRLDTLHEDALFAICGWVSGRDLARLSCTCRKFRDLLNRWQQLWSSAALADFDAPMVTAASTWPYEPTGNTEATLDGRALYRRGHTLAQARNGCWSYCSPDEHQLGVGGVEGHALCTWRDRWIICAGGYTAHGLDAQVFAVDTLGHHAVETGKSSHKFRWSPVPVEGDEMAASYGYSLTEMGGDRILKFGGVLFGGYMHSVDWCHVLHLSLDDDHDALEGSPQVRGRWEKVAIAEGTSMHSAAYHSAHAIGPDRDHVLIFAGMAESEGVNTMSVLELATGTVFHPEQVCTEAPAPMGRYGAAVQIIDNMLWVIGGCNGGDIRREGEDYNDVHVADLSELLTKKRVTWRKLPEIEVPVYCTGREMASAKWGHKVLLHGGSTQPSEFLCDEVGDRVCWFDTKSMTFGQPRIVGTLGPIAALSVEAVVIGSSMYIHGGWNCRGLIDSLLRLKLGFEDDELPEFKELQPRITDVDTLKAHYGTLTYNNCDPASVHHQVRGPRRAGAAQRYMAMFELIRRAMLAQHSNDDDSDEDMGYPI